MNSDEIQSQIWKLDKEIKEAEERRTFLEALRGYKGDDRVVSAQEMQKEITEENKKATPTIMSKIPGLDNLIGGFKQGQLVIISGPTGHGKTLIAQTLISNFSQQEIPCLLFSYEVGNDDLFAKFPDLPVFYLPRQTKQNSMVWLKGKIMEGIAKHDTKVVFIDHLHFLLEMEKMAQAKNLSLLIGMMMRELKTFAIQENLIIFLISHLKKSTLERGSMPTIDDLRDSSFVAQESDIVMMLRREEEKDPNNYNNKVLTNNSLLIVSKNRRTGRLGSVKLTYHGNMLTERDDRQTTGEGAGRYGQNNLEDIPDGVLESVQAVFGKPETD